MRAASQQWGWALWCAAGSKQPLPWRGMPGLLSNLSSCELHTVPTLTENTSDPHVMHILVSTVAASMQRASPATARGWHVLRCPVCTELPRNPALAGSFVGGHNGRRPPNRDMASLPLHQPSAPSGLMRGRIGTFCALRMDGTCEPLNLELCRVSPCRPHSRSTPQPMLTLHHHTTALQ